MEQEIIEGNKLKVSIKERDLVSVFMYGMKGIFPSIVTWNDLMPVVEKIESIYDEHHGYFGVYISSNSCSIQGTNLHRAMENLEGYGWVYMSDPNALFETKIKSTWYNVVEFIKWYNQNK